MLYIHYICQTYNTHSPASNVPFPASEETRKKNSIHTHIVYNCYIYTIYAQRTTPMYEKKEYTMYAQRTTPTAPPQTFFFSCFCKRFLLVIHIVYIYIYSFLFLFCSCKRILLVMYLHV